MKSGSNKMNLISKDRAKKIPQNVNLAKSINLAITNVFPKLKFFFSIFCSIFWHQLFSGLHILGIFQSYAYIFPYQMVFLRRNPCALGKCIPRM